MKERNHLLKLIILITLMFIVIFTKFSVNDIFAVAFKIVFVIIMIFFLIIGISIILLIRKIKQYRKISKEMEEEYRQFFESFFEEEYQYKEKSKYAKNNFNNSYEYDNYSYNGYNKSTSSSDLNNALRLFNYSNVNEIDEKDLKKRYRILIKQAHPDNGGSVERTQIVNEYYKTLSNII